MAKSLRKVYAPNSWLDQLGQGKAKCKSQHHDLGYGVFSMPIVSRISTLMGENFVSVVFDAQNLKRLSKVVKEAVGLELNDDELYDCAISVVRLTCAKLLRSRGLSSKEENNDRNIRK